MKNKEFTQLEQIQQAENELGFAVILFTWILGIAIGAVGSYIIYTL